jgi:hypothetical protein
MKMSATEVRYAVPTSDGMRIHIEYRFFSWPVLDEVTLIGLDVHRENCKRGIA